MQTSPPVGPFGLHDPSDFLFTLAMTFLDWKQVEH